MRVGIVGTGMIVHHFLEMQREREEIQVTALVSRPESEEKIKALADTYGIPNVYTDYEHFLAEAPMDFVYIGVVNSLHYPYVKRALQMGRNVINEKPFTSTYGEALELAELAREKGLFLFEAVTLIHFPNYRWIREHVKELGNITMVRCNFSQYSSRYDRYKRGEVLPAFDPELSGGALYDINIYNIHFTAGLFGKPENILYCPRVGFNGIDTSGVAVLSYPGFTAALSGAKDSASPGYAVIQGEKGFIQVNGIPSELKELTVSINGENRTFSLQKDRHRMVDEMLEFDRIFREDDRDAAERLLEHSLTVMEIAQEARKSGGIHFRADENQPHFFRHSFSSMSTRMMSFPT